VLSELFFETPQQSTVPLVSAAVSELAPKIPLASMVKMVLTSLYTRLGIAYCSRCRGLLRFPNQKSLSGDFRLLLF
jgi:hypothetical protein